MSATPAQPSSLIDCTDKDEVIVVEGQSAANAIKAVRNRQKHAVLPMQGKVPNATRVSSANLLAHPNIADLLQSLHPERLVSTQIDPCRYQRIIILSDPDADGVHASILLLLFLFRYVPQLIEQERLFLVRAPLFGFYRDDECVAVAYSETHAAKVSRALAERIDSVVNKRRFKGVASLDINIRLSLLSPDYPARRKLSVENCRELCQPLLP